MSDLISREALKKAFYELINEKFAGTYDFEKLIDNAPTVFDEKVLTANVTFDEDKLKEIVQTEVIEKIKSGDLVIKSDKRPQGDLAEKLKERIEESICKRCQSNENCVLCKISRVFQIITLTMEEQKGDTE